MASQPTPIKVAGGSSCLARPQLTLDTALLRNQKRFNMAAMLVTPLPHGTTAQSDTRPCQSLATDTGCHRIWFPKYTSIDHKGCRECDLGKAGLHLCQTRRGTGLPARGSVALKSSNALSWSVSRAQCSGEAKGRAAWVSPLMAEDSSCLRVSVVSSLGMFPTYSLCFDCEGATRSCKAQKLSGRCGN